MSKAQVEITPERGPIDGPFSIGLSGFPPSSTVSVVAGLMDSLRRRWSSHALFQTDDKGGVDLSLAAPVEGTYRQADANGLLWSLAPVEGGAPLEESSLAPLTITLEATGGDESATAVCERWFLSPGCMSLPVAEDGLVGTLFRPSGAGPFPTALALGGSAGGQVFSLQTAAALAGRGVLALSLAYFAAPGVPENLDRIPLEYFARAITWLQAQPNARAGGVGVIGRSRGGELALLLGATFPEVRAVVGYTPSNVVYGGLAGNKMLDSSAWSHLGKDVPNLAPTLPPPRLGAMFSKRPAILRPLFEEGVVDEAMRPSATIAVERIQGPVLLVSGDDDQMWPADAMCKAVMARLAEHRHPHSFEHHAYPNAGHYLRVPCVPTSVVDSPAFAMGGTPQGQAAANRDAWEKVVALLALQ